MNITILCDVVDNYGDIGFVYRLARSLAASSDKYLIRIVVNNLTAFSKMEPKVDKNLSFQQVGPFEIYDWNNTSFCSKSFNQIIPQVILQCFHCVRPSWLDEILFRKDNLNIVHIVNVEYLSAEKWCEEFHLLKSGTRSANIKKINFMPGFTNKTAGLVLDEPFMTFVHENKNYYKLPQKDTNFVLSDSYQILCKYLNKHEMDELKKENIFNILIFSYPRNFDCVIEALLRYTVIRQKTEPTFHVHIFAAAGKSLLPLKKSLEKFNWPFDITELPFLPQSVWDALLCSVDFLFIRGEDSLSRACLSGVPFIWHAYPQDEQYQLVKTDSLLKLMKPYFSQELFIALNEYWLFYNCTCGVEPENEACDVLNNNSISYNSYINGITNNQQIDQLTKLFLQYKFVREGFIKFSEYLESNGDMTEKLIKYVKQLQFS